MYTIKSDAVKNCGKNFRRSPRFISQLFCSDNRKKAAACLCAGSSLLFEFCISDVLCLIVLCGDGIGVDRCFDDFVFACHFSFFEIGEIGDEP